MKNTLSQTKRVVVLEDQRLLRDCIVALAAATPGLEVVGAAGDGRQGLELCESMEPALVLFDLYLPGLNGIEILRQQIRSRPRTRFIAISAHLTPDSLRELLEIGCHGIVSKSSSADKLREGLVEVVNGNGYLCPAAAGLLRQSHVVGAAAKKRKRLSNREREVLQAVAEGYSTKQIAELLQVSVKTVEAHRANLMKKLNARSAVELTRYAFELGIIEPPSLFPASVTPGTAGPH